MEVVKDFFESSFQEMKRFSLKGTRLLVLSNPFQSSIETQRTIHASLVTFCWRQTKREYRIDVK